MTHRTSFISSRRIGGFTLVELMITVVVLAIIVAIAVPSYQQQVRKSRRADARNAILDLAGREERFLSISNSYSQTPADMGYAAAFPLTVNNGYYRLTVTVPDPAQPGVTPLLHHYGHEFRPAGRRRRLWHFHCESARSASSDHFRRRAQYRNLLGDCNREKKPRSKRGFFINAI